MRMRKNYREGFFDSTPNSKKDFHEKFDEDSSENWGN